MGNFGPDPNFCNYYNLKNGLENPIVFKKGLLFLIFLVNFVKNNL